MKSHQPNRKLTRSRAKDVARGLLATLFVVSQCLIWWPSATPDEPRADGTPQSLVVTVNAAAQYGQVLVSFEDGRPLGVEVASAQLSQRISRSAGHPIQLRLSGGVSQKELARLRQAIVKAVGGEQVCVDVTFINSAATPHADRDASERFENDSQEARQP